MMEYHSVEKKGFLIDTDLAAELGLLDEYLIWEEEYDSDAFRQAFETKFGVLPMDLKYFEYMHEGYIQKLSGFDWDATYVIFDDPDSHLADWEKMVRELEQHLDVFVEEGKWSELG